MEHAEKPQLAWCLDGSGFFPFYWEPLSVKRMNGDLLASHRVENCIFPKGFRYRFKEREKYFLFKCRHSGFQTWLLHCEPGLGGHAFRLSSSPVQGANPRISLMLDKHLVTERHCSHSSRWPLQECFLIILMKDKQVLENAPWSTKDLSLAIF